MPVWSGSPGSKGRRGAQRRGRQCRGRRAIRCLGSGAYWT